MTYRCEYCGQLYEGLSCPHCGAPRGGEKKPSDGAVNDSRVTINGSCNQVVIGSGNSVVSVSQTINGNNNVSVLGNDNTIFADGKVYWTDDWAKWSEQIDPEWNPEEDPENVDYFLVDVDPYKDEQASKVGVPKPVEVEGRPLVDTLDELAAIAIFGLTCAALMLFWWLFSKL